jgi:hypothetical protein
VVEVKMMIRYGYLLAILLVLTGSIGSRAQSLSGPRGVYIYPTALSVENGDYEMAMAVPGVDGVAVVFDWSELSPSGGPKSYDFTELDRRIAMARAHHLAVELVIKAGKGVPEWMFPPPPTGLGARRLHFIYSHHNGAGPCTQIDIPPPWDAVYQDAFADLLSQVATHLRAVGAAQDVVVVKLTGLNTQSEELRLPAQTPELTGKSCVTDALTTWKNAGYRPALVAQAFKGLATSFARAFPDTQVTLAIILVGGFPPIAESGQVIPRGKARGTNDELLNTLVRAAATALPNRLILQQDFLIADRPTATRPIELARANGLPVAWQTNLFLGGQAKGAACGGEFGNSRPCDETSYLKLLQNGIHPAGGAGPNAQARYIEVFPADALAFPSVVAAAHAALTANP